MEFFSISLSIEIIPLGSYNYIWEGSKDINENYLFTKTANISKSNVHHKNARLKDFRFEYKEKDRIKSLWHIHSRLDDIH